MGKFQSTKRIDGFSTCFRQFASFPSNCASLHGYSIYFKVTFEGSLDYRNWISDFGFMKKAVTTTNWKGVNYSIGDWFKYLFDHSVIIAEDDPGIRWFKEGDQLGLLKLHILPAVGCERFAELVFNTLNSFIAVETELRVRVVSVECFETEKNSAIYSE